MAVRAEDEVQRVFSLYRRDTIAFLRTSTRTRTSGRSGQRHRVDELRVLRRRAQKDIALAGWDLVVIDEAHHARRTARARTERPRLTSTGSLSISLTPSSRAAQAMLLLTATPMQLHPFELYSLIELLDPTLFPTTRTSTTIDELAGSTDGRAVKRWHARAPSGRHRSTRRRAGLGYD